MGTRARIVHEDKARSGPGGIDNDVGRHAQGVLPHGQASFRTDRRREQDGYGPAAWQFFWRLFVVAPPAFPSPRATMLRRAWRGSSLETSLLQVAHHVVGLRCSSCRMRS
eukprot:TRINITY_DN40281_c0_g2_i1.p1 TRINITY_DN40281_c0_g2~~TRINITY_DN40281_c0_g2_i1.p1  ORF type:complete len:110 (-),score=0.90 TRINITY_DN40281_c0_g2_i1:150-479(-)